MTVKLLQVMAYGGVFTPTTTRFFQIQQRNFYALTAHANEHVLGIKAAMLPASHVRQAKGFCQFSQHMLMSRVTVLNRRILGVPLIQADKVFQLFSDQQPLPNARLFT